jgi:uncharacterized protein (TIGR00106 family)
MAIMEIVISPRGGASVSLSPFIARAVRVLDAAGLEHQTHAMGTNVEGTPEQLFAVAAQMHEAAFGGEIARVVTTIKIDDRRDKQVRMADKPASLAAKL